MRPAPQPRPARPLNPARVAREAVAQRNRLAAQRQHAAALAASGAMLRSGYEAGLGAVNQARELAPLAGRRLYQTGQNLYQAGQMGYQAGQGLYQGAQAAYGVGRVLGQYGYRAGQGIYSGAQWARRRAEDAQHLIERVQNARRIAALQRQAQVNDAVNAAAQEQMAAMAARFARGRLAPAEE